LFYYEGLVSEDGFQDPARLFSDLSEVLAALDKYSNEEG
jgi:hypothetical protein